MAGKKAFVLRVNQEVYSALEKWAAEEFRSVNGQIEWIIEKALKESKRKSPSGNTATEDKRKKTSEPDSKQ